MVRLAVRAAAVVTSAPLWAQQVPPVPLRLEFDPTATLNAAGEKVVVSAWFYGPTSSKRIGVDEMAVTTVRWEEVTVEGATGRCSSASISGRSRWTGSRSPT